MPGFWQYEIETKVRSQTKQGNAVLMPIILIFCFVQFTYAFLIEFQRGKHFCNPMEKTFVEKLFSNTEQSRLL